MNSCPSATTTTSTSTTTTRQHQTETSPSRAGQRQQQDQQRENRQQPPAPSPPHPNQNPSVAQPPQSNGGGPSFLCLRVSIHDQQNNPRQNFNSYARRRINSRRLLMRRQRHR